ncbi:hypothetical protein DFH09DRAFT_112716 [Mycena vulgaris]|nr:hypothetical protein DFH09DRAFT_112716 [Mycena vulgaris]
MQARACAALIMICLCSLFSTTSAVLCSSLCSVLAFRLEDSICCHEGNTTGVGVSVDAPTVPSNAADHGLDNAPIKRDIICPPVPEGYASVSMEELEEAARLGELLANEYAEDYAQESLDGVPSS